MPGFKHLPTFSSLLTHCLSCHLLCHVTFSESFIIFSNFRKVIFIIESDYFQFFHGRALQSQLIEMHNRVGSQRKETFEFKISFLLPLSEVLQIHSLAFLAQWRILQQKLDCLLVSSCFLLLFPFKKYICLRSQWWVTVSLVLKNCLERYL